MRNISENKLYIGLMSGTSMDGIDAVLVSFGVGVGVGESDHAITLIETTSIAIPAKLKSNLNLLCHGENISLKLLGETDTQMGNLLADAVLKLLKKANVSAEKITAIGSHGQTIYHHPNSQHPFTMQIGDPNIIAARTNITTVADFRRKDIAFGGQGAPLVPAFHAALFGKKKYDQIILNIGGIANITYLPADKTKSIIGFDTGPGNTLLDLWCEKNCHKPFDRDGEWARSGKLNEKLLARLLDDSYFKKPFPKSTGREYFNLSWLGKSVSVSGGVNKNTKITAPPADIQNTLTELTAETIANAITHAHTHTHTIWLCGGGAFNLFLIERLRANLPNTEIKSTNEIGIDPKWIEACAFAWLAKQTLEKQAGNLPSVTGAAKMTVLGGIFQV